MMGTMRRIWRKVTFAVAREQKMKKAKWEKFVKDNATRIATIPVSRGRKSVPAVWDPRKREWVWMTRGQRRDALRRAQRRLHR